MLTAFLLFLICFFASTVGAMVGAGGGVIIKPVVDALNLLPASAVSLLSSCTVFCMSLASFLRTRNNGVQLRYATTLPLGIGAAIGGFIGKFLFDLVLAGGNEATLKLTQAIGLSALMVLVLLYICVKDKLKSFRVQSKFISLCAGVLLGIFSSFFGIGGGPNNVALLFLLFSMESKEAAKNSIFIILLSQIVNLGSFIVKGQIPSIMSAVPSPVVTVLFMAAGGVSGALASAALTKRMNNKGVTTALKALCAVMALVNLANAIRTALSM